MFRGHHLKARLTQLPDELWDRRLGVRTFGFHPGSGQEGDREWYLHYVPTSYRDIFRALRAAGLGPGDHFVDWGCGLGRVVFGAAQLGARAEGVELVSMLADGAEANRRRTRLPHDRIAFHNANALDHAVPEASVVYLFHSFGPHILAEVLAKLRADRAAAGRAHRLRLVYVNPVAEATVDAAGWFRRIADLPPQHQPLSSVPSYRALIWESTE